MVYDTVYSVTLVTYDLLSKSCLDMHQSSLFHCQVQILFEYTLILILSATTAAPIHSKIPHDPTISQKARTMHSSSYY